MNDALQRKLPKSKGKPEHNLQVAIVAFLDRVLPKSIRVVAVANKPRSRVQGYLEKQRGSRKGFPDLLLTGSFHGLLEVKPEGQSLAPEQRDWRDWCAAHQVPYAVIRSIDDVSVTLKSWGVIR